QNRKVKNVELVKFTARGLFLTDDINVANLPSQTLARNKLLILVGTDTICRGIDFPNVNLVVNYNFPPNAVEYLHRCGRTGRGVIRNRNRDSNEHTAFEKVLSFFNEYNIDLAWNLQIALVNQHETILNQQKTLDRAKSDDNTRNDANASFEKNDKRNASNVGIRSVRFADYFCNKHERLSELNRSKVKMSRPRYHEKKVDLGRVDFEDCDPAIHEILKERVQELIQTSPKASSAGRSPGNNRHQNRKADSKESQNDNNDGNNDAVDKEEPTPEERIGEIRFEEDIREQSKVQQAKRMYLKKAKDEKKKKNTPLQKRKGTTKYDIDELFASGKFPKWARRVPFYETDINYSSSNEDDTDNNNSKR
ncbi:putative ATP-dependent RNA helicase, partial [Reticulomyxa filosa]